MIFKSAELLAEETSIRKNTLVPVTLTIAENQDAWFLITNHVASFENTRLATLKNKTHQRKYRNTVLSNWSAFFLWLAFTAKMVSAFNVDHPFLDLRSRS